MLDNLSHFSDARSLLNLANDVASVDLAARIRAEGPAYLCRNEIVSLLTAVFSLCAFRELQNASIQFDACAGYSVGQWVAMAAAEMLDAETLLQIIWRRSQCMNSVPGIEAGAMLGVIGLPSDLVESVCRDVSEDRKNVMVSNYNCIGQVTIAGHRDAVLLARSRLAALGARQLLDVEVSGAWHCSMMAPAATAFRGCVDSFTPSAARVPVIDNVTGSFLPAALEPLRSTLIRHLERPVQWERGVKTLMQFGIERYVEVGFGNLLTKFGFFIDRTRMNLGYESLLTT
jgi:[acyl-carrier-protein] S-malonyltransferase